MNSSPATKEIPSPDELPPELVDFFEKFPSQAVFLPIVLMDIINSLTGKSVRDPGSWDFKHVNYLKSIFHPEDFEAFLGYVGLVVKDEVKFALADGVEVEEAVGKLQKLGNFVKEKLGISNGD